MRVREYDADDAEALEVTRRILNAARAVDAPFLPPVTSYRHRMDVRYGFELTPTVHLAAYADDGRSVGVAAVELTEWDNHDLAWVELTIDPACRRQGHGSSLLAEVVLLAHDRGRTKLAGMGWDTAGIEPFAARHGCTPATVEVCRVQDPTSLPEGLVQAALDEARPHAGDYELLRLFGRTPGELLPEVAVMTAGINDAPFDDLDMEDEVFTPDRIRAYESASLDSGHRFYRLVARHRGTGRLAGQTVVLVDEETPEEAHQHDTSVLREHRGHRLGLLLKAEMMRWLAEEEPQVRHLDTWNAESNGHMIAVNERLGYEARGRELAFQRRL